ncbi:hypothetical protein ACF08B_37710 [Streptomyces sp. NPDC015139]|uniref:hypothetical protein n=1 Tax=Streptomyces sp. NPDC015139 TaxID=3364942 RepID=UPI0036FC91C0
MRTLASSTRTSRTRNAALTAAVLLVLAALYALTGSDTGGTTRAVREGNALDGGMQSAGNVGYEHAQVGHEYWAGLPLPWNTSRSDIRLTAAEFTHVPKGLKVVEYRAFDAGETDGNVIFASTDADESSMGDLFKMRNYAGRAMTVKAKSSSRVYYVARVKVTGPVHDSLSGCRYSYRQGATQYQQHIDCSTIVRLGPPLK